MNKKKVSLPFGWEVKQLAEISEFQRGLTYSRNDTADFSNNIVLRATNISLEKSCLIFDELKYLNDTFFVDAKKKVVKGGLLICLSSGSKDHLGKIALIDKDYDYAFGGFIGQIIPNNSILSKYLFYNLISSDYKKYISELTDGININNLKTQDLKSFCIATPSIPEQKQIVSILDKAFAAIDKAKANAEQNLKNAKELFESYLQEVFENKGDDWEDKTLDEVCSIGDGNYSSKYPKASEFVSEGVPFLTATNLKEGTVIPKKMRYISELQHSTLLKGHVKEGDLVIVVRGSSTGNNSIVPKEYENSNLNSQLAFLRIRDKKLVNNNYLFNVFNSPNIQNIVLKTISGAAQPQLPNNKLLKIKIPIPSLKDQEQIINELESLSSQTKKLQLIYSQKIDELNELKKSILQKAFSGELTTN
ncbi:MAG: restriction endonuclease subunit S [Crocinitomicaceae bacterium]